MAETGWAEVGGGDEEEESLVSVRKIQGRGGARFKHTELSTLIARGSEASLNLAWRLMATMKDDEIRQRCEDDRSTYLHLVVDQVPTQWRRQGGGGSFRSPWVDVQKLCNMCVLSLSWNFFVSHDKYTARPSSKEPR